jgi:hypothetical protein
MSSYCSIATLANPFDFELYVSYNPIHVSTLTLPELAILVDHHTPTTSIVCVGLSIIFP